MGLETITVKYAKLFKVDILLHHLLDKDGTLFDDLPPATKIVQLGRYRLGDWMQISPTAVTKQAMAGLDWGFKHTATGFLVVASTDLTNPAKVAIMPPSNLVLAFDMVANRAVFGQFSAFPLPGKINGKRAVYLFDNAVTNAENAAAFPSFALTPLAFSNATTYGPGDMVRSGSNHFVAKTKTKGVATYNGQNWLAVTESLPYANSAQLVRGESFGAQPNAFGLIRIHCGSGLGIFGLFNGQDLASPNFSIRLRNQPAFN